MLGRRKELEQKMDTHVLNLQEIKQAASTEKKVKKQRSTSLLLFFLGLFMIVMGILYPIIMDTIHAESEEVSNNAKENTETTSKVVDRLSCTYSENGIKINKVVKEEYEFDHAGLIKITTTTDLTAVTDEGKADITTGATNFNSLYGSIDAAGIEKKANLATDSSGLITILSIDYHKFNVDKYNANHADKPFFVQYQQGTKKEVIQQAATSQNALCS